MASWIIVGRLELGTLSITNRSLFDSILDRLLSNLRYIDNLAYILNHEYVLVSVFAVYNSKASSSARKVKYYCNYAKRNQSGSGWYFCWCEVHCFLVIFRSVWITYHSEVVSKRHLRKLVRQKNTCNCAMGLYLIYLLIFYSSLLNPTGIARKL